SCVGDGQAELLCGKDLQRNVAECVNPEQGREPRRQIGNLEPGGHVPGRRGRRHREAQRHRNEGCRGWGHRTPPCGDNAPTAVSSATTANNIHCGSRVTAPRCREIPSATPA